MNSQCEVVSVVRGGDLTEKIVVFKKRGSNREQNPIKQNFDSQQHKSHEYLFVLMFGLLSERDV